MSLIFRTNLVVGLILKETKSVYKVSLDLVHPETGELTSIQGEHHESNRYYRVSKLTTRINSMDLFDIMGKICKSGKDNNLLGTLMHKVTEDNRLKFENISHGAKELGIARSKLNDFLKRMCDVRPERLAIKIDTGIYFINPFIFTGKRTRSNKLREELQDEWIQTIDEDFMDRIS